MSVVVNFVYVGAVTSLALFVVGKIVGNRVSAEDEIAGLDIPEMGLLAYPDDAVAHGTSAAMTSTNESGVGVVVPERAAS